MRVRTRALAIIAGVVVALAGLPSAAADDWPQPWYDGGRTWFNPTETTLGPDQARSLELVWSRRFRLPDVFGVVAVGRALYVEVGGDICSSGAVGERLVKIRVGSGAVRWRISFVGPIYGGPMVGRGAAVIADAACSVSDPGTLAGWSSSTGGFLWNSGHTSGVMHRGLVHVATPWSVYGCPCSLVTLDPATGEIAWSLTSGRRISRPLAVGRRVFVADGRMLRALRRKTGEEIWHVPVESTLPSIADADTIAATGGAVYVTVSDELVAIDPKSGAELWRRTIDGVDGAGFAATPDHVLVGRERRLVVLDAPTGRFEWRFRRLDYGPQPVVANGVVYVGVGGSLLALDLATGGRLGSIPGTLGTPVVVGGTLYVGTPDHELRAYR